MKDIDRRTFLRGAASISLVGIMGGVVAACSGSSDNSPSTTTSAATTTVGHIRSATAVTEVLGAGLTLAAVALEYDAEIDGSSLTAGNFTVDGRTVTRVYTNSSAAIATADQPDGQPGKFVIVELDTADDAGLLWNNQPDDGAGGADGVDGAETASADDTDSDSGPGAGGPQAGSSSSPVVADAVATVTATGTVTTTSGETYEDAGAVTTSAAVDPLVDLFTQATFTDPDTGDSLPYNIFAPAGVDLSNPDGSTKYPLVLFMHDASVVGADVKGPLVQGQGAVCWASPDDQERHPCFVVAPQYPTVVVSDDYEPTSLFDTTVNLLNDLVDRYPVDPDHLHATGQSMGAMMTLGMNIRHPELLASSYVVAGQWPAEEAAPLAQKKLWVTVSQGDEKAFPMENDIMDVIREAGTEITEATWDATWDAERLNSAAETVADAGTPVNYTSFLAGTVPGASEGSGAEHMGTWKVAYTIPAIRDRVMED
ncbi:hypothetical protein [Corynebacterium terpenotabidum]|uniref:Esterase Ig-like N-terminal domain-containing protein n=1 Tax=Corynebacterium terpenotabidum Y-11 TaxID=1200352 RepID=S4XGB4_9CORY|nr:hypothetical protein [Corynebacterium terpenotabidum]AGP31576.1 hypothetical protein A606_09685 [Corynebacterium terpenotabidum Y-11]